MVTEKVKELMLLQCIHTHVRTHTVKHKHQYLLSSYVQEAVNDKLNPPSNFRQTFQVHMSIELQVTM